jgi:hypothetical protein
MSEPVEPCPTCPEGWKPLDKEHCAECYEGQIERLRSVISWVDSWVSNPASAYSTDALEGLFGMTRDKIAALPRS